MNPPHDASNPAAHADFAAFVGIDWADRCHALCLRVAGEHDACALTLDHTPEALDAFAPQLRQRFGGRPVAVAVELSRGPLIYALCRHAHLVIHPVPPARLSSYRKAFVASGAKDDPTDARLILDYLLKHRDQLRPWRPEEESVRRLRALVEQRRAFVEQRTALSNQLVSRLKTYFPQAIDWIGDKSYGRMACDFLTKWPDLASVQRARPATVRAFYFAHGVRRADVIQRRLEAIAHAAPLTDDPAIIDVGVQTVLALAKLLHELGKVIAGFDKRIRTQFAQHQDMGLFASLPGAGKALAPRLLCALGADRSRFTDARQLQAYSGIAPVTRRSGRQHTVHRRWAAPTFLRQTFHEFAQHSIGQSAWAAACYQQQRQRGAGHHAAVRALAFKWIRILFACWRTRTPYDESRYHDQLRRRRSPLQAHLPDTA